MKNPVRTIHCSKCGKAISGYDMEERMGKLRRHYKIAHPKAFASWIKKSIKTRMKQNPFYPLVISTINPENKFKPLIKKAVRGMREMYGDEAKIKANFANIPGIEDGDVLQYVGELEGINYRNARVADARKKPNEVYVHTKGDKVFARTTNPGRIYQSTRHPNIQILVFKRRPMIKGMYDGS